MINDKAFNQILKTKNIIKKTALLNMFHKIYTYLKIILLFTLLWIFFSGNKDPLMIACGIVAIIMTFCICLKAEILSTNSYIIKLSFVKYVYMLLRDVILSSIQMVKIIYTEKLSINPGTTIVNVGKLTNQEKVLFANLITMTPGTFVIAIEGDNFLIHALNRDDLSFKNNREITNLLTKMRDREEKNEVNETIADIEVKKDKITPTKQNNIVIGNQK